MADDERGAVEDFALWLRQVRLSGGDASLRELERRTRQAGTRVARSTLQDALDATRLPSIDHAVAMVRAMTGDEAMVQECRRRWTRARSAMTGVAMPEIPLRPTARQAQVTGSQDVASPGNVPRYPEEEPGPDLRPRGSPPPAAGEERPVWWRRKITAVSAVLVLAAAGGGVYVVRATGSPQSPRANETLDVTPADRAQAGGDSGAHSSAYTPVYVGRPLSLRDYEEYFDLIAGVVVAREGAWTLSTNAGGNSRGAFELQSLTDAYLAGRTVPTVGDCVAGLAQHPTREVRFPQVPPGTSFCLRDRNTGDIAVVRVNDLDYGNWAAAVFITYYRASVPSGTRRPVNPEDGTTGPPSRSPAAVPRPGGD
ncbi:hypothetical protein ACFYSC_18045 [Streptosporangium sp. NPDC004379]|uniref:hypothetical protein n=1 Tax=Streptosporangium sp. NPDC004379 TaxID=3366189 RepID=UPI0036ACF9E0